MNEDRAALSMREKDLQRLAAFRIWIYFKGNDERNEAIGFDIIKDYYGRNGHDKKGTSIRKSGFSRN
jgi:hypothetical protein